MSWTLELNVVHPFQSKPYNGQEEGNLEMRAHMLIFTYNLTWSAFAGAGEEGLNNFDGGPYCTSDHASISVNTVIVSKPSSPVSRVTGR